MSPATTTVAVELVGDRAQAAALDGGDYLRPRLLSIDGPYVRIALIGVCGMLLAGDEVGVHIEIGHGVQLEIIEPAGMVAYDARGGRAGWTATARVASGGVLVWRGAPFVVSGGADVRRHTELSLEEGARALLGETLVLGRSGEDSGRLHATLRASHAERELLTDELDLRSSALRSAPGILGNARVLTTAALLGVGGPAPAAVHETRLAGPGCLARALAQHAHEADAALEATWSRWRHHAEHTTSDRTRNHLPELDGDRS
ncbi:urease accessory protein UreD [Haloactinomyces albus]|uniref:Urease accessory protein UreD n=1 Tax=Haloactinomyces albus TaxID=1352928 RepID=A0AAE3ZGG9_9ACTN|nr:urease accessory protein UreD [Haloactinomyces albus]MDR7303615.1 urease accessory protein [Haloactinomyces albus]